MKFLRPNPILFFLLAATSVFLSRCENPIEGVNLTVNTNVLKAPVMIQFVNAKSGAAIQPDVFTVSISGPASSQVVNNSGGKEFKAIKGCIYLNLDKTSTPSATQPMTYTVYADIPGFVPATQTVYISNAEEPQQLIVPVVEYANPTAGTAAKITQTTLSGNATTVAVVLSTSASSTMTETSKITIPAGTQFLDAAGKVITATSLESRVVHYGTGTESSLQAFPGGFYAGNAMDETGKKIDGGVFFTTAGLVSIDMFASGTRVKGFSKPIEVELEINNSLINPSSGNLAKETETVPVWSLNEIDGSWKREGTSTYIKSSSGKLIAKFSASHLSAWNLDYYGLRCSGSTTITIIPNLNTISSTYSIKLLDENGNYLSGYTFSMGSQKVISTLYNIPRGSGKYALYSNGRLISEIKVTSFCGQNITFSIPEPNPKPDIVNVDFSVTATCAGKNIKARTSGFLSILDLTANSETLRRYISSGELSLKRETVALQNGNMYLIETTYDGKQYYVRGKFEKKNFTFPPVDGLSLSSIYNSSTNTLVVEANFVYQNCK